MAQRRSPSQEASASAPWRQAAITPAGSRAPTQRTAGARAGVGELVIVRGRSVGQKEERMALRRLVAIVGRGQAAVVSGSLLLPMACNSGSVAPCSDPVQVVLAPADTTLSLGSSFAASVRLTVCGESKSASDVIAWRSDDATVAVVDAGGQVTGTGVGATRIRATSEHYGPLGSIELFVYNSVNPTSAEARAVLRYYVERVKRADTRQYSTSDDLGHSLDGRKL